MNAPIAVARSTRSSGMKTSPMASPNSSNAVGRRATFDGERHLQQRVRARDAPVAAERQHGAGAHQARERVLPRRPLRADERDRQVVHLALVCRPERLAVRDRAQPPEPRDVVGMHDLDVRQVVAVVARTVRDQRGLDRVERLAHRTVAQRVEVRLEPERVQLRDRVLQQFGIHERDAGVVRRHAVRIEVRRQRGRGEVLDDAVLHDLHARRREASDRGARTGIHESLDLLEAAVADPTTAPRSPGR